MVGMKISTKICNFCQNPINELEIIRCRKCSSFFHDNIQCKALHERFCQSNPFEFQKRRDPRLPDQDDLLRF